MHRKDNHIPDNAHAGAQSAGYAPILPLIHSENF